MKSLFYLLVSLLVWGNASGQITNAPEQNCTGAIPICGYVFSQPNTYAQGGTNSNEVPAGSCLTTGETNSVWYTFQIDSPGQLNFLINPISVNDDYDFALYDISNNGCHGIPTSSSLEVRCDFAISPGAATGLAPSGTATSAGPGASPILKSLTVTAGQKFALLVNNFTAQSSGHTLDFSASTCTLGYTFNQSVFNTTDTIRKGKYDFILNLSTPIDCYNIDTTGIGFTVPNAGWHISKVKSVTPCNTNPYTQSLVVTFDSIQTNDTTFNIILNPNRVSSYCGAQNTVSDTVKVRVINVPLITGFTIRNVNGDTVVITNQSQNADSIYYYIEGSSTTYQGSNPIIVLPDTGSYTICQVITNFVDFDTLCQAIRITAIGETNLQRQISLSPNPTTGKLNITIPNSNSATSIEIFNTLGVLVVSQQYGIGQTTVNLDISQLPPATYILYFKQGGQQSVNRVIKF